MEIIRLSEGNLRDAVEVATVVLKRGGIVLYPTDTLYGLAVDATNADALVRMRDLKGREKKKPISVVVPDLGSFDRYADAHPEALRYAERFLPGPLTLVVPGKDTLPMELMLNGQVGLRIPDDPFARALATRFGPFTATSANRSGLMTLATPERIIAQFGPLSRHIDLIIDAGPREGGVGSTVLAFRDGVPVILREGRLTKNDLGLS